MGCATCRSPASHDRPDRAWSVRTRHQNSRSLHRFEFWRSSHLAPGAVIDITPVEIKQEASALCDGVKGTQCQCNVACASVAVPDGVANAIKVVGEDVELQEPNARIELLEDPAPVLLRVRVRVRVRTRVRVRVRVRGRGRGRVRSACEKTGEGVISQSAC